MARFQIGDLVRPIMDWPSSGLVKAGTYKVIGVHPHPTSAGQFQCELEGLRVRPHENNLQLVTSAMGIGGQGILAEAKKASSKPARRLTAEGERIKSEFDNLYKAQGCTCTSTQTCDHCKHPGHPYALEHNTKLWEAVPEKTRADEIWEAIQSSSGKGNT